MRETEPRRDHEARCDRQNPRSRPKELTQARVVVRLHLFNRYVLRRVLIKLSESGTSRTLGFHDARRAARGFDSAFQWARIDGVNVLRCEVLSKELGLLTPISESGGSAAPSVTSRLIGNACRMKKLHSGTLFELRCIAGSGERRPNLGGLPLRYASDTTHWKIRRKTSRHRYLSTTQRTRTQRVA